MTVWPVQDAKARFSELLDKNVVSELRRPKPHGALLASVTLGEIQAGIELTRDQDPAKSAEIQQRLDQVNATFNVLPRDWAVFCRGVGRPTRPPAVTMRVGGCPGLGLPSLALEARAMQVLHRLKPMGTTTIPPSLRVQIRGNSCSPPL
jgi:hypothetical protein